MKTLFKSIAFIAILVVGSIAQADQKYNYSYDFNTGDSSTDVYINNLYQISGNYIVSGSFTA